MVNNWEVDERWAAPGDLELVRRLLNTWQLRLPQREDDDRLPELVAAADRWEQLFPDTPAPTGAEIAELQDLRDALRDAITQPHSTEELTIWFQRHPVLAHLSTREGQSPEIRLTSAQPTATGRLVAAVAVSIQEGTWERIKACPDCRLVFFDRSRNRSKRWCGMYAGDTGRACGSIAKVRHWRQRHQ